MSRCEVSIEFDRPNRQYQGGETISGSVHVVAKQALTYDSITLTGFWRCHGYGFPVSKEFHGARIDGVGHLLAGETRCFPFSFVGPSEPVTYHGSDLNIDHYVRIEVDSPKAKIQECTEQYCLKPGVTPRRLSWDRNGPGRVDSDMGAKQGMAFNLVMLFISAGSFLIAPIFGYFFFGILVLTWVHTLLFRSQLSSVVVTTPNTVVGVGEDYNVTVSCTPRMNLSLKGIRVKLRCLEKSTQIQTSSDDSGGGITGIRQEIYTNHNMFSQGAVIESGQRFTTDISGMIPQTEAYSFATAYGDVWEEKVCAVSWELQVSVSTRLFASWTGTIPIQVVPPEFLESSSTEGGGIG
jgi:hypothetical protein